MSFIVVALTIAVNVLITAGIIELVLFTLGYKMILDYPIHTASFMGAGLLIALVILLSLTPIAEAIFRRSYHCRNLTAEQAARLVPLFKRVCQAANMDASRFDLYIVGDSRLNAFALGRKTIAINQGLFPLADREIMAVLAHELGHHKHGDTINLLIHLAVTKVGQIALFIPRVVSTIAGFIARVPIPFLNLFAVLINLFLSLYVFLIDLILLLPLRIGYFFGTRRTEYKADEFAIQLGFGHGLIHFLRLVPEERTSFFGSIWRTHPKVSNRIKRAEKLLNGRSLCAESGIIPKGASI